MARIGREQGPSAADEFARLAAQRHQQARGALRQGRPTFMSAPGSASSELQRFRTVTESELAAAAEQINAPVEDNPKWWQVILRAIVPGIIAQLIHSQSEAAPIEVTEQDRRTALLTPGADWTQRERLAQQSARQRLGPQEEDAA